MQCKYLLLTGGFNNSQRIYLLFIAKIMSVILEIQIINNILKKYIYHQNLLKMYFTNRFTQNKIYYINGLCAQYYHSVDYLAAKYQANGAQVKQLIPEDYR